MEIIPALGHEWDEGVVTTEPTCEDGGIRTFTCKNNPDHIYTEAIEALGHDWNEGEVTKEAACETPGEKMFTCKNDEEHRKTEEIPALGHTPAEAVKENVVEATTQQEGSYDEVVYCSECKEELSRKTVETDATGHKWSEWKVTTEPTETSKGEETRSCENCKKTETREIPAAEHKHTNGEPVKENENNEEQTK